VAYYLYYTNKHQQFRYELHKRFVPAVELLVLQQPLVVAALERQLLLLVFVFLPLV
jgi:hypothetical protein